MKPDYKIKISQIFKRVHHVKSLLFLAFMLLFSQTGNLLASGTNHPALVDAQTHHLVNHVDYGTDNHELSAKDNNSSHSKAAPAAHVFPSKLITIQLKNPAPSANYSKLQSKILINLTLPDEVINSINQLNKVIRAHSTETNLDRREDFPLMHTKLQNLVKAYENNKSQLLSIDYKNFQSVSNEENKKADLWDKVQSINTFLEEVTSSTEHMRTLKPLMTQVKKALDEIITQESKIEALTEVFPQYLDDLMKIADIWENNKEKTVNHKDTKKSLNMIEDKNILGSILSPNNIYFPVEEKGEKINNSKKFNLFLESFQGVKGRGEQEKTFKSLETLASSPEHKELAFVIFTQALSYIFKQENGNRIANDILRSYLSLYDPSRTIDSNSNQSSGHMPLKIKDITINSFTGLQLKKMKFLGIQELNTYSTLNSKQKEDRAIDMNQLVDNALANHTKKYKNLDVPHNEDKTKIGNSYAKIQGLAYQNKSNLTHYLKGTYGKAKILFNKDPIDMIIPKDFVNLMIKALQDPNPLSNNPKANLYYKTVISYLLFRGRLDPARALKEIMHDQKNLISKVERQSVVDTVKNQKSNYNNTYQNPLEDPETDTDPIYDEEENKKKTPSSFKGNQHPEAKNPTNNPTNYSLKRSNSAGHLNSTNMNNESNGATSNNATKRTNTSVMYTSQPHTTHNPTTVPNTKEQKQQLSISNYAWNDTAD